MTFINIFIFVFSIIFSLYSYALEFRAGAFAESLNPPKGISLAGYGGGQRRHWIGSQNKYAHYLTASKGVLDDVRAKAVVLQFGSEKLVLVSLDLVAVPRDMLPVLAIRLMDLGINENHIFISATHTHSGPGDFAHSSLWEILAVDKFVPEVFRQFTDVVEHAVREAYAELRPAVLAVGQRHLENAIRNRRHNPELDPEMTLIRVDATMGGSIANIINFPIHGTVLDTGNLLLSADIPGSIERALQRKSGAPSFFFNGAEGDVSPDTHGTTVQVMEDKADQIANDAALLWQGLTPRNPGSFKVVKISKKIGKPVMNIFACANSTKNKGNWLVKLPVGLPTEAQMGGFTIDGHAFVTVPGEPITIIGSRIKASGLEKGFKSTSVMGLTNDHLGYIVDKIQFKKGGYEACANLYGPELGDKIVEAADQILSELR